MALYIVSYDEIGLKGKNRWMFENALKKRISTVLNALGNVDVQISNKKLFVEIDAPSCEVLVRLQKVFGVKSISISLKCRLDIEQIKETVINLLTESHDDKKTFKIRCKRANKSFHLTSIEVDRIVGAYVLEKFPNLKVDVHNPDIVVNILIRENAYIFCEKVAGEGGLPVGTVGKALLLISGGIDSPVAGYLTMKRGASIDAIYFHSFPFTSDRAKEKVIKLCKVLAQYCGQLHLYVVNFTEIIKELVEKTPNSYLTIMMRRMMVRIAQEVARKSNALALVTGESLGQVASQTMESIFVVNSVAQLPILRPVIGLDKSDIINLAKKIGTYEISVEPYADCCSVFVPKAPITKPRLDYVMEFESSLDIQMLVTKGLENVEKITVKW